MRRIGSYILAVLHWFLRLRVWLALLAIMQGVVRVTGGTSMMLAFGDISIGWLMLAAGILVLGTYRLRFFLSGRLAAISLAAVYGVVAAASLANLATCGTAILITAAMVAEAGSSQSDC
jgi:hypothetical protein